MELFRGKSVVVTGAASGIGHALCRALCAAGAAVYAADRDAGGLAALQAACAGLAAQPQSVILDVSDEAAVSALLRRVAAERGSLDYVFNNAGIFIAGDSEHMTAEGWRRIVDVNLWGVIHGTQHAYALMLHQGHGHIVNTASTAGLTPLAKSVAYAATKHAVVGLSLSLREEGRRRGVKVSVVVPGLVDTGIFASATRLRDYDHAAVLRRVPLGKIAPERAAQAILAGVAANRRQIVFPAYNRLLCWLYRLAPGFMACLINRAAA